MRAIETTPDLGITPAPGTRIIRREDYARWVDGECVREAAERFASRLRERAAREYERRMAAARDEGLAAVEAERAAMLSAFAEDTVRGVKAVEATLEEVVVQALREMLGHVPSQEQLAVTLRRLLEEVADRESVEVGVNPADRAALDAVVVATDTEWSGLKVRSDRGIAPGRVRIEHPLGISEGGLDAYLDALSTTLPGEGGVRA